MSTTPPPACAPILPGLFISSMSDEFRSLRLQVEVTVRHLGYHPITMDHWSLGHGELRAWLRQQIDQSEGLIHIPGIAYGAEPTDHDPAAHGLPADTPRYSYTQYEFLYARHRGKKTWVITPGSACTRDTLLDRLDLPKDPTHPDPSGYQAERRALQTAYLQRLKKDNHLRHSPQDDKDLRLLIHTLRDHAQELRENFGQWQTFVTGYMQQMEKRSRELHSLALGTLALLIVVITSIWWVKRDTAPTVEKVDHLVTGQADIAAQMSQVQAALSCIQQQNDPAKDPISQWPQERLEDELARQMQMSVADLRAILLAGRTSLDALLQGQSLLASGKPEEAGAKFDQVLQQEANAVQRIKQAYEGKAQIAFDQVRYTEALDYRQKAAALVDKSTYPLGWTAAQEGVCFVYLRLASYKDAEPLLREILRIREYYLRADHPYIGLALSNLGSLLQDTNRLTEAEPLMQRALQIEEANYGPDHPKIAVPLNNLSTLFMETNRMAEAEPLIRRALEINQARNGPDHPDVAAILNNLAQVLQATNRITEAEVVMRRVLSIFEKAYGENHPHVAGALNNLARLLQDTHRIAEAEPLMRRMVGILKKTLGEHHPTFGLALNNLALLLRDENRFSEAELLITQALKIYEASFGPDHPDVANVLHNLAQVLEATNRFADAEPLMRRTVVILLRFQVNTGHLHPNAEIAVQSYEILLGKMGRTKREVVAQFRELFAEVGLELHKQ